MKRDNVRAVKLSWDGALILGEWFAGARKSFVLWDITSGNTALVRDHTGETIDAHAVQPAGIYKCYGGALLLLSSFDEKTRGAFIACGKPENLLFFHRLESCLSNVSMGYQQLAIHGSVFDSQTEELILKLSEKDLSTGLTSHFLIAVSLRDLVKHVRGNDCEIVRPGGKQQQK